MGLSGLWKKGALLPMYCNNNNHILNILKQLFSQAQVIYLLGDYKSNEKLQKKGTREKNLSGQIVQKSNKLNPHIKVWSPAESNLGHIGGKSIVSPLLCYSFYTLANNKNKHSSVSL